MHCCVGIWNLCSCILDTSVSMGAVIIGEILNDDDMITLGGSGVSPAAV